MRVVTAFIAIAVTGVASLAVAAVLAARSLRVAATVALLVSAAEFVLWMNLM